MKKKGFFGIFAFAAMLLSLTACSKTSMNTEAEISVEAQTGECKSTMELARSLRRKSFRATRTKALECCGFPYTGLT